MIINLNFKFKNVSCWPRPTIPAVQIIIVGSDIVLIVAKILNKNFNVKSCVAKPFPIDLFIPNFFYKILNDSF